MRCADDRFPSRCAIRSRCSTSTTRSRSSPARRARSGAAARSRSARSAASCCSPPAPKDELDRGRRRGERGRRRGRDHRAPARHARRRQGDARRRARSAYGRVDQLVVASGINKPGFIQDLAYEDWQAVMDANVRGIWLMAKAVGSYWIENKVRGKVLLMSSVRGRHGNYLRLHRLLHLQGRDRRADPRARDRMGQARHHRECASRRRCFAPSSPPGCMATTSSASRRGRARSSRIPLGRLGEVEDLIGMAIYLLSPASDFCTGQVMYVDGGYTAG